MEEEDRKRRGDIIENDLKRTGISEENAGDQVKWKYRIRVADPK